MRNANNDLFHALELINPCNIIPSLEQSIELEELKFALNPSDEIRDKIRELNLLLTFFRVRRLGC